MLGALLAALALGAPMPEAPQGDDVAWSVPNGDATYVARQSATDSGCHLEVLHDADQSVLWHKDACFGGHGDRKLLSRDGSRLMVFAALPPADGSSPSAWRTATVAWLFEKGHVVDTAVAGQLVRDASKIRKGVTHFSWLQGVGGVPGVPPRLDGAGDAVLVDAIDGKQTELKFTGFRLPPLGPEKTKKHRF
jgi:hypothetical protein